MDSTENDPANQWTPRLVTWQETTAIKLSWRIKTSMLRINRRQNWTELCASQSTSVLVFPSSSILYIIFRVAWFWPTFIGQKAPKFPIKPKKLKMLTSKMISIIHLLSLLYDNLPPPESQTTMKLRHKPTTERLPLNTITFNWDSRPINMEC